MAFWEGLSGKKKSFLLVLMGIIGVFLVLWGSLHGENEEKTTENLEKNNATMAYIDRIENKIGNIAEQITGSSRVRVIVSVATGSEFEYLSNEEIKENYTSKEYITVRTDQGADMPVLQKEIYPEIVGVSVACRGGDLPEIQMKLIQIISTTYGLSSNRICVVGIP